MSIGAILAAIGALGAIATLGTLVFKWAVKTFTKTPEQKAQEIAVDVQKHEQDFKDTGRPT